MKVVFNPSLFQGSKDDEVLEIIKNTESSPMKDTFLKELDYNKYKKRNIFITIEAMEDNSEGRIVCKSEKSKTHNPQPTKLRKAKSV